jgi:hypothetical protein
MNAAHARPVPLNGSQWILACTVTVLASALAGLAFLGMFTTVRAEEVPYFGRLAWDVPASVDLGIVAAILMALLFEWMRFPWPPLRIAAAVFMAASAWLNWQAAHGHLVGAVGHIAAPVLFVTLVEGGRHWVRHRTGIAAGTVRDGIPLVRWVLAPWPSWRLHRRMVLQRIVSYPLAAELDLARLHMTDMLRAELGTRWRGEAPRMLARQLRTGRLPEPVIAAVKAALGPAKTSGWEDAASAEVRAALTQPDRFRAGVQTERETVSQTRSQTQSQTGSGTQSQTRPQPRSQTRTKAQNEARARRVIETWRSQNPGTARGLQQHVMDKLSVGKATARELIAAADSSGVVSLGQRRQA